MPKPSARGEHGDAHATLADLSQRRRLLFTARATATLPWLLLAATERALALTVEAVRRRGLTD